MWLQEFTLRLQTRRKSRQRKSAPSSIITRTVSVTLAVLPQMHAKTLLPVRIAAPLQAKTAQSARQPQVALRLRVRQFQPVRVPLLLLRAVP
ncbi:MAG: hypothetical protein MZV63_24810 [Marinilabiliales bacterium]|nr:hypothetical protein [Marinilabiliales bacterium]